jgi:hypothetical protein
VVAGESDPGYFDLVSVEDSMAGLGRWLRGLFPSNEEPDRKPSLSHDRSQASGPESFADENNDFALDVWTIAPTAREPVLPSVQYSHCLEHDPSRR